MEYCLDPVTIDRDVCPGLKPPEGVMPMQPSAYSLRPFVIETTIVCLCFTVTAVAIRMFTKGFLLKKMQIEDYSLLVALTGYAAFIGFMNKALDYNFGKHQWNVSIADTMSVLKYINQIQILYSPPMFFAKLALLLQIQRIFTINQRNFIFWASWFLIVANGAIYISVLFASIFACVPREKIWNPAVDGKCIDVGDAMITTSAINFISDVAILALPLLGIWSLQMPLKRKIGVGSIFAVGLLASATCIIRLIYTVKLIRSSDVTYWAATVAMWAAAEFATVILCCCFPTFPRFITFLRGKDRRDSRYSWYSTQNVRPSSNQTKNTSLKSPKSPYSWTDTIQGEEMGPYIVLEERSLESRDKEYFLVTDEALENTRALHFTTIHRTTNMET